MKMYYLFTRLVVFFLLISTVAFGQTASIFPANPTVYAGKAFSFQARATGFCGNQRNYTWTAPGTTTTSVSSSPDYDVENRFFTFNTPGTYTISVQIFRTGGCGTQSSTVSTTVTVLPGSSAPSVNMWAGTDGGGTVSNYSVAAGLYAYGPEFLFDPFPGSGATTAAIARSPYPTPITGYFYWLENTNDNDGFTTIYGANGDGTGVTTVGSIDVNGSITNDLGFVRFAMDATGKGWILTGDGTTLYLVSFTSNALNPVTPVVVDDNVTLVGGTVSTFFNGDLCMDGNGNMYALANDGAGVTQIFVGKPNGTSTTLTKKWDLVDQANLPFGGSVNGVCFDLLGNMYISSNGNPEAGPSDGLYFINQTTVNGAAGTVQASFVHGYSGFTDLGTNVFPFTILLPVKLSAFTVVKQNNNAILNWTTASEVNAAHFDIEKSLDGINFVSAGKKQAVGNSSTDLSYNFSDPITANTGIIYYRLKTVDIDGRESYSKTIPLKLDGKDFTQSLAYPNPFTTDLKVLYYAERDETANLQVFNAAGQVVADAKVSVTKGANTVSLKQYIHSLQKGNYIINLITAGNRFSQKVVKSH